MASIDSNLNVVSDSSKTESKTVLEIISLEVRSKKFDQELVLQEIDKDLSALLYAQQIMAFSAIICLETSIVDRESLQEIGAKIINRYNFYFLDFDNEIVCFIIDNQIVINNNLKKIKERATTRHQQRVRPRRA